ncbi:MAG: hypothetical protein NPINA01_15820 [Nitrospinaceae bacterium]|nr:MAG: hypothetical protein NPINA01_15820 [Nitrospinaceae bacterium]
MPTVDISKMTKDDLLKLAAKRKIAVKKSMLKSEIQAVIKKEMKKIAKATAAKKAAVKTKKTPLKKTAVKAGRTPAKAKRKEEKPKTSPKAKSKKPALTTKPKGTTKKITATAKPKSSAGKTKSTPPPSKALASRKKEKTATKTATKKRVRKKTASPPSSPSSASIKELRPKFELEDSAQEAKFIIGKPDIRDESHAEQFQELPANYGDNKLVLLVRDPYWCFLYWELQSEKIAEGLQRLHRNQSEVRHILRIHSPSAGGTYFDVDVDFRAESHYIQLSPPGASFFAEIGLLDPEGHFAALAISNTITLPLDGPSDVIDEKWMTTSENFEEIYALSGGRLAESLNFGSSEELQKIRSEQRRLTMDFSSSSVSSFSSGQTPNPHIKTFSYRIDAEQALPDETNSKEEKQ